MKTSTPIQLPRPNPGPEPWSTEPGVSSWWPLLAGLMGVVLLIGCVRLLRRWRRARTSEATATSADFPAQPTADDELRTALIRLFGEGWRALTTEEMARSPEFAARFDPEVAGRLIAYLRQSDQARFSGGRIAIDPEVRSWGDHFLEFIGEAGPMSTIRGR